MSSLLDKISELEQQIVELKAEVEKEEKESKNMNKRWRGKIGDFHWFVNSNGTPSWSYDFHRDTDNFRYDTHNYFQTEEEAQKYADALETERQLRKFANEHNGETGWNNNNSYKCYLSYSCSTQSICTRSVWTLKEPRVIYFSSKEIAQQAIAEIGEEEITEYLTYEW